ncbi:DUF2520 domain-containing protein [Pedobacter frigiditerrae]|uniref:DUF2520 domain-containing protein n=1 Tax=Pedobacter frigiditerrae TaxID=2530452 RepID=A0A4R0MYS6_9SPHI|nr:Rossmann-like and DUF2520 domain-containing protein [Pedobacter frigiditerrae]TCC92097.1 DUF2520 domain-containing protein [Pedobacter frigiditerrae]
MKVVVIGAGNVATHLAKAIYAANVQVTQVWSYHNQNAQTLANQINAKAIANLNEIDLDADVCLISIKDDAIADIANQLKDFRGLIAHTSGAVNLEVFANHFENYGVFYPLQTFSKSKDISFADIPLCLEANNESSLTRLKELAGKLSKNIVEINSEKRKMLHLAAVFACNFTNHLYELADEILKANQLEFDILRPLIVETAAKVQNAFPLDVQTGPAIRNDEQTLIKHQELLLQQPQLLEIYKILSDSIKKTI